jgi:hypothetical protein
LHVQLEDLFEKIRRNDLLFGAAGRACLVGGSLGLLFEMYTFEPQQIFGAKNRIFQSPVGVVELRSLLQAPLLFFGVCLGVDVGMELAAERV